MEKMTYVTEDGTILFTPPGTDPDTGYTITGLAADGKYMYLEDIALHLANTEQRLKKYLDTDITPQQLQKLSRMYQEKCEELAKIKAQLPPCKVGDTIYIIRDETIETLTVECISCYGGWKVHAHTDRKSSHWVGYEIEFKAFGKTAFFSKKEAEKKLEEMEGN